MSTKKDGNQKGQSRFGNGNAKPEEAKPDPHPTRHPVAQAPAKPPPPPPPKEEEAPPAEENISVATRTVPERVTTERADSKAAKAREIFDDAYSSNPVPPRKEIISKTVQETGLTPAGAATYLQNYKTKKGLAQKRTS